MTRKQRAKHDRGISNLAKIGIKLPQVLTSGTDQIFVLDREQRMQAFFGHWPEKAPYRLQDLLGKRKRDVFGPEAAAIHEAAGQRALEGENVSYEWTVPKGPNPVHLFTAASPIRNDVGEVTGVLLVTRNITALKEAHNQLEQRLREKTSQLHQVEEGVRRAATALLRSANHPPNESSTTLDRSMLSPRESEVLAFLDRGARVRSIAEALGISVETVRRHVKTMFRKTGAHSQEELVKLFAGAEDPITG